MDQYTVMITKRVTKKVDIDPNNNGLTKHTDVLHSHNITEQKMNHEHNN